jgi:hypothetical protein
MRGKLYSIVAKIADIAYHWISRNTKDQREKMGHFLFKTPKPGKKNEVGLFSPVKFKILTTVRNSTHPVGALALVSAHSPGHSSLHQI